MNTATAFLLLALLSTGTQAFAGDVKSVSRLAFGPDNILFVADWKGDQVHALTLPAPMPKKGEGTFNIVALGQLLSKSLHIGQLKIGRTTTVEEIGDPLMMHDPTRLTDGTEVYRA